MKRDMDLIRRILIHVEAADSVLDDLKVHGYDDSTVLAHVQLMSEADLLKAAVLTDVDHSPLRIASIWGITWNGYEFLDSARDEGVWRKAKSVASKKGIELPFSVLQSMLESIVRGIAFSHGG